MRRLERWQVRYGAPVDSRPARHESPSCAERPSALMARDRRARGVAVSGTLLAIDGDSLAHRAYHALPKSIRAATAARRLRATSCCGCGRRSSRTSVLVGWDSLDVADLPARGAAGLPVGARVRAVDPRAARAAAGARRVVRLRRGEGAAGTRPTTSSPPPRARWTGPVLVVTSDRDAFQLVSDRVTILQPVQGRERARADRARPRCASATASSPAQVPDFIALRGDPSDKIPGAPGVGPKTAATSCTQHGTLEAALADGRFPQIADDLRLYRRHRDDGRRRAAAEARTPTPPDWARRARLRARARA